jgi:hypothetical protein
MAVTQAQLRALVGRVPVPQQKIAEAKIRQANMLGYKMVGYWEWAIGTVPHHNDLVGISPSGEFDFLPEPDGADDQDRSAD